MAKKSMIEKEKRRQRTVEKHAEERERLREIAGDESLSQEERVEARRRLALLPRDANPVRLRNRCAMTGRPRGYIRWAGLSRIAFRQLALRGELPGVRKASL